MAFLKEGLGFFVPQRVLGLNTGSHGGVDGRIGTVFLVQVILFVHLTYKSSAYNVFRETIHLFNFQEHQEDRG